MRPELRFESESEHCSLLYYRNDKNDIYRPDYHDPSVSTERFTLYGIVSPLGLGPYPPLGFILYTVNKFVNRNSRLSMQTLFEQLLVRSAKPSKKYSHNLMSTSFTRGVDDDP
ncbi:hypothetical protein UY3_09254 [Chelonia mydas]|uniref:Uncharacterized protein n=1 Tax=Chelonia mydas TaxID=8469 RepID=M7BNE8_CHEMY|nr:hypothetical protein UY3_09254 [Chelonia mydas]